MQQPGPAGESVVPVPTPIGVGRSDANPMPPRAIGNRVVATVSLECPSPRAVAENSHFSNQFFYTVGVALTSTWERETSLKDSVLTGVSFAVELRLRYRQHNPPSWGVTSH